MNKNSSRFFSYGVAILLLSSLGLIGCPKKVAPVEGSAGLSKDGRPPANTQSPVEKPDQRPAPTVPPREEPIQQEEKVPPMAKSESEGRDAAGEGQPGPLQDIFFEFDQWVIQPDAKTVLEKNVRWLEGHPQAKIQIEGHSDERGTDEYNLALGERRAKSAMKFLTTLGVSPSRITFISYGEEKGFCNEKSEACYQKNRRAHFVIQR
jgi:peptidoglycan-associated lipoprotein